MSRRNDRRRRWRRRKSGLPTRRGSPPQRDPGLIGGLIVGATTGKAMALAHRLAILAVNHLEAHALTVGLTEGLRPPYLLLLVSGGHTQLLIVHDVGRYERLGTTIDDALGEAFDKTAKLLGLADSRRAGGGARRRLRATPERFDLPRPMLGRDRAAFLFRRPEDRGAACGAARMRRCRSRTLPISAPRSRRRLRCVVGPRARCPWRAAVQTRCRKVEQRLRRRRRRRCEQGSANRAEGRCRGFRVLDFMLRPWNCAPITAR